MPAIAAAALLAVVPIFACPEPVAASPTAAAYHLADGSTAGIVLGDSVNVRSGPGTAYDVVAKLQGGARVAILGEAFGWLLVRPEAELRVYVSRDLIEPKGDGIAVVKRDRVNLRSKAAAEGTVVGQASRGDLVRLLEPGGEFAAIAAPPDVGFYVHHDLVRRVDPAEIEATVPAAAPAAAPERAVGPTPGEKLARARELYLAELDKSEMAAMDFREAQKLYEAAASEAAGEDIRFAAAAGLKRVRIAIRLQEDYRRRLAPLERMVGGEREPCQPAKN
jgi:SH3-like domain-containing protein